MRVENTALEGLKIIHPTVYHDERGFFLETFQQERYSSQLNIQHQFVQDNHSRSMQHVLRGLHFQKANPQGKLIRVIKGSILDVAVDIRPTSNTFGDWVSTLISADKHHQVWVPPGFAHGFLTLSSTADVEYKCTNLYDPEDEYCIQWNDPDIGIEWPNVPIQLSEKDRAGLPLRELLK